jgi:hypothetical protein
MRFDMDNPLQSVMNAMEDQGKDVHSGGELYQNKDKLLTRTILAIAASALRSETEPNFLFLRLK